MDRNFSEDEKLGATIRAVQLAVISKQAGEVSEYFRTLGLTGVIEGETEMVTKIATLCDGMYEMLQTFDTAYSNAVTQTLIAELGEEGIGG